MDLSPSLTTRKNPAPVHVILDLLCPNRHDLRMGPSENESNPKKIFAAQAADLQMWQASRTSGIAPPACKCLEPQYGNKRFPQLKLHAEVQDMSNEAWKVLEGLVADAVSKGAEVFAPGLEMPPELWCQIVTLPPSISRLTSVRKLYLYGSNLVRLPVEVGDMVNLEELDLYTSYRLHWAPYEVTRCSKLKRSRVSTRALYGNYKYRPPFPKLGTDDSKATLPAECSVCRQLLRPEAVRQVWISLRVATDVLPLLVNACSDECIDRLPPPTYGYIDHPHTGGVGLAQPPSGFVPPRSGG